MNATRKTLTVFGSEVHIIISVNPDTEGLYVCQFDRQRNPGDSPEDLIGINRGETCDAAIKAYIRSCMRRRGPVFA